ncbi:MAG TPA: hypothetical protein VF386_04375 [Usitatibacter sp.]
MLNLLETVGASRPGWRLPLDWGEIVRRNNFILGSARRPVKEILVHCTRRRRTHCRKISKCNKMKYLSRPDAPASQGVHKPELM